MRLKLRRIVIMAVAVLVIFCMVLYLMDRPDEKHDPHHGHHARKVSCRAFSGERGEFVSVIVPIRDPSEV